MNPHILHTDVQEYIIQNSDQPINVNKLILAGSPFSNVTVQELAQQIIGRSKAKQKLPTWFSCTNIYYPPGLNLEQTSSEITARYKSQQIHGHTLIDLTGGFGIDDYFFTKVFKKVIHCEMNEELSTIASHNFGILQTDNVKSLCGDGIEILKGLDTVDWIYIDPSRRHESKGKVFFLEDCLPNVPEHLDFLLSKSTNILIKTSPLLDISSGIKSLKNIKEIHVVAVENEVKELLWFIEKGYENELEIKTVNLQKKGNQEFDFIFFEESQLTLNLSEPKKYLYEPNAAIMKSGGFTSVSNHLSAPKLHRNSHLYTSDELITFPGRRFEIIASFPYQKKILAKTNINKANITTRNFQESVSVLRKKFKIKDGGQDYLFFTTDCNDQKIVLQCKKVDL
ncbi:class I SAM-dependent methyltransferase [Aquimarina spongiae]|uniref:Uncharacterized protein n=1 Tax=Aquimarina spongiae TaxID=570521 RepID=A0A1M6A706_9FLAO|nr:SAM-dependent methyltransferase [Aquimarina spongiae]SHI32187.1 hypothetical protein SAMN04488508_101128 [Aquimarina spongiae]